MYHRATLILISLLLSCTPLVADEPGSTVDPSTLSGKVMCGYQGWFNCEGDGSDLGWKHWARQPHQAFAPGNVSVDLWPDLTEFQTGELFQTGFKHADGRVASVFSSANADTVARHFKWMRDYGIDGAFLQRFAVSLRGERSARNENRILANVRNGARRAGRTFAVMYDLSGLEAGQVRSVQDDWSNLHNELHLTSDDHYQHHNGKPVVAVWGLGFNDDRKYSLQECYELVLWLKSQNCSVMVGLPSFWRDGERDAVNAPLLYDTIKAADIVSPWSVGRYRTPAEATRHANQVWKLDRQWCQAAGLAFMPVAFPGFSWSNLKEGKSDLIPRLKGQFLWSQVVGAKRIGCDMIYIAMFDEVDEGTAIFKCTNDPPDGNGASFLDYDGLPSDHYLKIAAQAGKLLRGEIEPSDKLPIPGGD